MRWGSHATTTWACQGPSGRCPFPLVGHLHNTLGVISKFAESALHSISEGLKTECPPSDLGTANIRGREEKIVSISTLMQKTRCSCWVGLKFVFCFSPPILAMFLLTSHCLGNFNWNQQYWQLFQLPFIQGTKILHTSSYCYSLHLASIKSWTSPSFPEQSWNTAEQQSSVKLKREGSFSSVFPFFCLYSWLHTLW